MTGSTPSRFAVELALPVSRPDEVAMLHAALAAASRRLRGHGVSVRLLRTSHLQDRRGAVCLFEADSPAAVRRVVENAQVPILRIDLAVNVPVPTSKRRPSPSGR